jgi:hypothetical protein
MVPNHGLIIQSLLYGDNDFQKSLMIVNTSGWDTDCNSGNVGCLLGIKNGLAGMLNGPDWRGPVADRMYLATADGGRAITNAASEAYQIINIGRALVGKEPVVPKNGVRFHFELPGSVQGFMAEESVETHGTVTVENVVGYSETGQRSLALHYNRLAPGRVARVATATFIPSLEIATYFERRGYRLMASPTLYPGQTVRARLVADSANRQPVQVNLYVRNYDVDDALVRHYSPPVELKPGQTYQFRWQLDQAVGSPIAEIGVEINGSSGA